MSKAVLTTAVVIALACVGQLLASPAGNYYSPKAPLLQTVAVDESDATTGEALHNATSNTHYANSDTHSKVTITHRANTVYHYIDTTTHTSPSFFHSPDSKTWVHGLGSTQTFQVLD